MPAPILQPIDTFTTRAKSRRFRRSNTFAPAPGMYIGRIGDGSHYDDGVYVLLKEVIDNAIDEFIMGHGNEVHGDDQRRGCQSCATTAGASRWAKIVECVSRINTGAKYNDDVFQFSVGLNGVGTKAVNALVRRSFTVASFRDGQFARANFKQRRAHPAQERHGQRKSNATARSIEFSPDPAKSSSESEFKEEHVTRRSAALHVPQRRVENPLQWHPLPFQERAARPASTRTPTTSRMPCMPPLHHREKTLELALTHTQRFSETHYSFVNGQFTSDGGTHLSAFREGVLKAVNDFTKKKYEGDDVREGLVGRGGDPAEGTDFRVPDQEQAGQHGNSRRSRQEGARHRRRPAAPQPRGGRERSPPKSRIPRVCGANSPASRSSPANAAGPSPCASRSSKIARCTSTRKRGVATARWFS